MEVCQGRCPSPREACLQPPPSHGPDTPERVTAAELSRRYPEHPREAEALSTSPTGLHLLQVSKAWEEDTAWPSRSVGLLGPCCSHVVNIFPLINSTTTHEPLLLYYCFHLTVEKHESVSHSVMSDSWQPMQCSPPGSSVLGILQVRVLEWVAILFSRGSSRPRDWTQISHIAEGFFAVWSTR